MAVSLPTERFWPILFGRFLALYIAFSIGNTLFSNWRYFPSVDFNLLAENWGKFFVYVLFVGGPCLLASQLLAIFSKSKIKIAYLVLADLIFVALYLFGPISQLLHLMMALSSGGRSSSSFGVSEGAIVTNGVITELGKTYYFMMQMKDILDMAIFLLIRLAGFGLWSFKKS